MPSSVAIQTSAPGTGTPTDRAPDAGSTGADRPSGVAWVGDEVRRRYGVTVQQVKLKDTAEAVTRVLIESEDEQGERWTTIGVSPNIIDASFQALMDSIVYKLVKSGAPA